jgi:uncharacterized membrane-anchored protein YjiN (DUF445 family)
LQATSADLQGLAGMRRLATGLLVLMALVFLAALHFEKSIPPLGFVRAFAEAAMVGALADWFAVTALFRHPLGIPIPHTAIIPRNKDRIGENMGRFVEQNFLAPALVAERVAHVDFAGKLARWLAEPAQGAWLAGGIASVLPRILHALDDSDLRRFAGEHLVAGVRKIDFATVAAEVLELMTRDNRHHVIVTQLIEQAKELLEEFKPQIRERIRKEVWWGLRTVSLDELLYNRIVEAIEHFLEELRDTPTHEMRARIDARLQRLIADLKDSPEFRAQGESLVRQLLENRELQVYLAIVWHEVRDRILADAALPASAIRSQLQASINNVGLALLRDEPMQEKFNVWLRHEIVEQVAAHGHHVSALIADTVRRWDPQTITEKAESEIGKDLQFIRINGTLIGGLVGLVLHTISLHL